MLREALRDDKSEIYDVWKHAYPNQSRSYLNYYFKHLFDLGRCVLYTEDRRIVSSIQINEHILRIHGKYLMSGYLTGVSTLPDYRRRGHMRTIMESVLDEEEHNHLITLIQAFNPKLYEQFGFTTVYYQKFYTIYHEFLVKSQTDMISYAAEAFELLNVYQEFVTYFDGSYERDEEYYSLLLKELITNQKKLIVYRDEWKQVKGYLICQKVKNDIIVREAIYLESAVLLSMLKAALGKENELIIQVSEGEKLEKIFPLAIPKKQPFMMARINNFELFNKLFNTKVKTVKEAFEMGSKHLWIHEYY